MTERGKCQRAGCQGNARAPWFSCPDPEGDCTVEPEVVAGPLTFPPEWLPAHATEGAR